MSKKPSVVERARKVVAERQKGATAIVEDAGPKPVAGIGEKVRVTKGELVDEACVATVARLDGSEGRIDGNPYVAVGGPSKGKLVQPVKLNDGTLIGVPTDRLASVNASGHSRPSVGWSPSYAQNFDRIFGRKRSKARV